MSVSPGQRFGSYEIAASIGAGGMGEVFRARDTNLKRDVALKLLPKAFLEDQDRLARFRREAEMLAALNHPNIAQVYGLEKADGQTAIVMELVEGPTLADRIQQGPIPPDEAMAMALQIVAALEAAHDKGIVHRDLKPANVKLREDGTVKVLDFGISKPIDPKLISGGTPIATTPAMTQTGIILGTAAYMSPEQARGRFVDERTDIWAFGCLLLEMLTGQPAFGGEDMMAVLARVIDRDTDLSSIPRQISPAVRHTIRLCLQKDPRQRIADIRDVRLALEGRFESDLSRSVDSASQQTFGRLAFVSALALAAGAAFAALVALVLWPEPPAPRVSRWVHTVPAELRPALESDVPVLAVAPDGSEFSYATTSGLVRRPLSEIESRVIPGTAGEFAVAPHYSADGAALFYGLLSGVAAGPLKRVGTEGGTPRQLLPTFPNNGWWPAASGDLYGAMSDDRCIIARIPPEGGEPETVFENSDIWCAEPILLPDGDRLLSYGAENAAASQFFVMLHSIAKQETRNLFPGIQPTLVDSRWIVYFEPELGLSARAFDPARAGNPESQAFGRSVQLVGDVLRNAQGNAAHFRVSAGGETLVYLKGSAARSSRGLLAILRPDGTLDRLDFPAADFAYPALSADGSRLVVTLSRDLADNDAQLWVYDMSGETEPRQLRLEGNSGGASWAPNGELVFSSGRPNEGLRVWQQDAAGLRPAQALTNHLPGSVQLLPVYTPDGRLSFLQPNGVEDLDTYIMELPDGEPVLLHGGPAAQFGLDFAPDGRAFAIQSGTDLLVGRYPPGGSAPLRIAELQIRSMWPVWSGDSTRLAYQSGSQEITIVNIDTEALAIRGRRAFAVPLRPGLNMRLIEAVPDSEDWLVVIDPASGQGPQDAGVEIVVIEGFLADLEARVPPL